MLLEKLQVVDSEGNIYKFTKEKDENFITEIHYCTSYYCFKVFLVEDGKYIEKDLAYINENANPFDLMCILNKEICNIL